MEFRINLENNVGFRLIQKYTLRFFWIQSGGSALILSLHNMKLDSLEYFTDEREATLKKVLGNAELCQEGSTLAGRVSAQTPGSFLGTSGYISPLLKSTSKPGPYVRIGERKHPFAMKCELFLESQRVVGSIRTNSGNSKQNTLTAHVDKHLPNIQN